MSLSEKQHSVGCRPGHGALTLTMVKLDNTTPLHATMLRGEPEAGIMLATVIIKVAYAFDGAGKLERLRADEVEILEEPKQTSLGRIPADDVPYRPGLDLYVLGYAHAPSGRPTVAMTVELRAGNIRRELLVVGDRTWTRGGIPTPPVPFVEMPLIYERAYGGKATQSGQEILHPDNPEGRGFVLERSEAGGAPLPNLEDPNDRIISWESRPTVACWAPLSQHTSMHAQRSIEIVDAMRYVYRYQPEMFHVAHPALVLPNLPPGEMISLRGVTRSGELQIPTPDEPLRLDVTLGPKIFTLRPKLDTLGIHAHAGRVEATFRTSFRYRMVARQQRRSSLLLERGAHA